MPEGDPRTERERRRAAADRMRGILADVAPGRSLVDELIAERRAEARAEDREDDERRRKRVHGGVPGRFAPAMTAKEKLLWALPSWTEDDCEVALRAVSRARDQARAAAATCGDDGQDHPGAR
jgi:hypothetical protein